MMKTILRAGLLVALATTAWTQVLAAAPSSITIVGKQMNVPIEGKFKNFSSQIQFDPANPAAGKATIEVEVASIDFGDDDFNYELRTKPWFDAKTYPKAAFTSSVIKALGKDRLEVSGKLSIKGKSADVTVPVTLKTEGAARVFEGALPIKRTSFNVGEGEWRDTSVVADEVQIRFRLIVAPK
jgi:polyisoprenoid-binding protein YceI